MIDVIGIRFKKAGKVYYFDPNQLELALGNHVIVETVRGIEFGEIVILNKQINKEDIVLPLKKVIRVASAKDLATVSGNVKLAEKAMTVCTEKIAHHKLEMSLVDVEYTFDRSKVVFYFTAEGRIDFRNLVKDLAALFKTRIELRQIGVRDEAKLLGGIGPCGRMLCCSTFLGDFEPVSIKMAKDQNLSLNPVKISGLCGRLMCCLKYESDTYEEAKRQLPDYGKEVSTSYGRGRVVGLNILEKTVKIKIYESNNIIEFSLEELKEEEIVSVPVVD